MNLHFVPINKYDTVIEHFDGSITIPYHEKKRYLFTCLTNQDIYILNTMDGCLYQYFIEHQSIIQINSKETRLFKNNIGIAYQADYFVSFDAKNASFNWYHKLSLELKHSVKIDIQINNFTIDNNVIWACDRKNAILYKITLTAFEIEKTELLAYKGIGNTSLLIFNNELFITDSEENTIRCYDLAGTFKYEAITPFIDPIGQIYHNQKHYILYGGLVNEVGYENRCWQEQKPFFHALELSFEQENNVLKVFSNAFEVEFFYEEHINEITDGELLPITINLAIPPETDHQKVIDIVPLGLPYKLITEKNISYAQFQISELYTKAIGYKATLQLRSVKYNVIDSKLLHLQNNCILTKQEKDELGIENPYFNQYILNSNDTNIEKIKKLRNTLYSKIYYKKNTYAQSFEEILKDGYGTCGDYASLMLIFLTKNNITCQSVGGYKIPRFYISQAGIMSIYYNHAWIEVFDKDGNFVFPIESSSDDKEFENQYSEGQFFGIDWTHIKLYNGKTYPNSINIPSHPHLHPFDILNNASVFASIKKEL